MKTFSAAFSSSLRTLPLENLRDTNLIALLVAMINEPVNKKKKDYKVNISSIIFVIVITHYLFTSLKILNQLVVTNIHSGEENTDTALNLNL